MQTISIPYHCSRPAAATIREYRRVYSAAVRTAYANTVDSAGRTVPEKDVRQLVKSRFTGKIVDAWTLHCATLEGRDKRKLVPDGTMVFGSAKDLLRRNDGLIDNAAWRERRLLPLCSRGDKTKDGNRHFRLSLDGLTCILQMYGQKLNLRLARMTGNAGAILRQAAQLAADKVINLTFRIDETHLHVTVDPEDLPEHPERRRPVLPLSARFLGIDLNPEWIGAAVIENTTDPTLLSATAMLDHALMQLALPGTTSGVSVREVLAGVCDRIISMTRKYRCAGIAVEKGLGKLRSGGWNRDNNRKLNYWARTVFTAMLKRKAKLAGLTVVEVWAGYSSTIGNLAFEAADACASAAEIARRGLARSCGMKDVLPAYEPEACLGLWKDQGMPKETREGLGRARSWGELHRGIKSAKIGYRRPHPGPVGPCPRYAVRRLGHKHRPGWIFQPRDACARGDGKTRFQH